MESIPEIMDGLPNNSGWEDQVRQVTQRGGPVFRDCTAIRLDKIQSSFAVALHMHQPLILGDHDLRTAPMIGNLQFMMENQRIPGNQDAPVLAQCYNRLADFIRELANAVRQPRVMLDYSGELWLGLRWMGRDDILIHDY